MAAYIAYTVDIDTISSQPQHSLQSSWVKVASYIAYTVDIDTTLPAIILGQVAANIANTVDIDTM